LYRADERLDHRAFALTKEIGGSERKLSDHLYRADEREEKNTCRLEKDINSAERKISDKINCSDAKAAECCCELKALVNDIDKENIKDNNFDQRLNEIYNKQNIARRSFNEGRWEGRWEGEAHCKTCCCDKKQTDTKPSEDPKPPKP